MIALSDWRIRWEDGQKFDYKKGKVVTLSRIETRDFYRYNGRKTMEDKNLANEDEARHAKAEAVKEKLAKANNKLEKPKKKTK